MTDDASSTHSGGGRGLLRTRVLLWVQLACGVAVLVGIAAPVVLGVGGVSWLVASTWPVLALAASVVPLVALRRVGPRTWLVIVLSLLVSSVGYVALGFLFGSTHGVVVMGYGVRRVLLALRLATAGGGLALLAGAVALLNAVLLLLPSSRAAFGRR